MNTRNGFNQFGAPSGYCYLQMNCSVTADCDAKKTAAVQCLLPKYHNHHYHRRRRHLFVHKNLRIITLSDDQVNRTSKAS